MKLFAKAPSTMLQKTPLYQCMAAEVADLIAQNVLQPGDKLPSVRRWAMERKVANSTVVQALHVLEDQGLIEARPQSGFFVKRPDLPQARQREARLNKSLRPPVAVDINERLLSVLALNSRSDIVLMGAAFPATPLLPTQALQRLYGAVSRQQQPLLATEGNSRHNHPELVRQIARHSLSWGKPVAPEEIVIVNSCTEALSLCLRACTKPGDTVAVESPTYYAMLQLLELFGLKAIEIPTHRRNGLSVDALEMATRKRKIAACILVSNFNNPLGSKLPDEEKQRLVDLCDERSIALIDDDTFGDLYFGETRPSPLKAFDRHGTVMHCSSFSKTLSATLRLGYIAGGRRHAQLLEHKNLTSGITNPVTQAVAAQFMASAAFDRHLRQLRRALHDQVRSMRKAVEQYFPQGTRASEPQGGLVLWVELPQQIEADRLLHHALKAGVLFVPGNLFSASAQFRHCLRLSCGDPWSPRIDKALQTLGALACKLAKGEEPAGID